MTPAEKVKVGQIYRDKDKRMEGRYIEVVAVENGKAVCAPCSPTGHSGNRKTRHSFTNLQKRFELTP